MFLGVLVFGNDAGWAYRFYPADREGSLIPRSDVALRWNSRVWGLEDTLVWQVPDDPDWSPHFADADEALPLIEAAGNAWSSIPTADIRFRFDRVTTGPDAVLDGRNVVRVVEDGNYARRVTKRNERGEWEMHECDVTIDTRTVELMAGQENPTGGLGVLIHEMGHCVGLAHAQPTPTVAGFLRSAASSVWKNDPNMSYTTAKDDTVTEDDAVGASLLRPVGGWLGTTGSISGTLTLDGERIPFVSIHALRNDGGRASASVQVFSDEEGAFSVEGLPPGEYLLWIYPAFQRNAHRRLVETGRFVTSLYDLVDPRPIRVMAGRKTPAGEFAVRRSRNPR